MENRVLTFIIDRHQHHLHAWFSVTEEREKKLMTKTSAGCFFFCSIEGEEEKKRKSNGYFFYVNLKESRTCSINQELVRYGIFISIKSLSLKMKQEKTVERERDTFEWWVQMDWTVVLSANVGMMISLFFV